MSNSKTLTRAIPREEGLDHTLSLLREGYMYISNRRHSFNSNVFETRLLGKKAICIGGKEAAELFYDTDKFKREDAAPNRMVQTLLGKDGVQNLDGKVHRHRKEMFMSIMSRDKLAQLIEIANSQWEVALNKWEQSDKIVLYEEVQEILCRTACQWAGVPVPEDEVKTLTQHLKAMFESPAALGPAHWAGRYARNQVEKWVEELIQGIRDGKVKASETTALYQFAWHRDVEGNLLDNEIAAVEVINILRPIVAISIFISFTALALHHYEEETKKLEDKDEKYAEMFVQEVRRYYPFFPVAAALVQKDFTWNGFTFEQGTLTLLDLYGTNHDPDHWDDPERFNPERFRNWEGSPFGFIPQGGGDYLSGHRCAGEWVTIEVMKLSLDFLVNRMKYEVPDQDLSYSLVSIPSIPHSKIVLQKVRRKA